MLLFTSWAGGCMNEQVSETTSACLFVKRKSLKKHPARHLFQASCNNNPSLLVHDPPRLARLPSVLLARVTLFLVIRIQSEACSGRPTSPLRLETHWTSALSSARPPACLHKAPAYCFCLFSLSSVRSISPSPRYQHCLATSLSPVT